MMECYFKRIGQSKETKLCCLGEGTMVAMAIFRGYRVCLTVFDIAGFNVPSLMKPFRER